MKETLGKALRLGLLATLAGGTVLRRVTPPAPDPRSRNRNPNRSASQDKADRTKRYGQSQDSKETSKRSYRGVGKGIQSLFSGARKSRWARARTRSGAFFQADRRSSGDRVRERVGQNLVRNSDARVPFTIKVIDSRTK